MKITKRHLRKIIKEERAKLLEQRAEPNYRVLKEIDDYKHTIQKELNSRMSLEDRIWYDNPEHIKAIGEMLDEVKAYFIKFGEMK